MPLIYTHIRYANKCLDLLEDEYKKIIENNYVYYLYGTQGPNIFKYHSPITNKKYIELSNSIHNNSISNTLNIVKNEFKNNKDRDAILAYTFGYITHFVLDSYIDSYLYNSSVATKTNINALKSEIDRYYIQKDKININSIINKYKNSNTLNINISKILNVKENIIKQSLENMIQYSKIIYIKEDKILFLIKKITKNSKYKDLFVNGIRITHSAQILRFEKYFEISKYHCQQLLNNFINYIFNDDSLDSYFFNTFKLTNNSPILNFNDERKYIINEFNK